MRKVFLLLLGFFPMLLLAQSNSKPNQKNNNNNSQTLIDKTNMKNIEVKQTAGRTALGDFAPEFAHLNDDVLFGEVWNRNDKLSLHDRSMLTVTALVSMGITDNSLK